MANVKLGNKTFSGVSSVKLDTTDGGTVTFEGPKEVSVGGLTQYVKFTATPELATTFTITNPLGGAAKKVSVSCPAGSTTETELGFIQKYTMDASTGIGGMRYYHATNGNLTHSGAYQVDEVPAANSRFYLGDGQVVARGYSASNGIWDTECAYEVEIWQ